MNSNTESLLSAVKSAEDEALAMGQKYDASRRVPLKVELTDKSVTLKLKGVEMRTDKSELSGTTRVVFGTKPVDYNVPFYDDTRVTSEVAPPLYYIIPPQWKKVLEVLSAHGLRMQRLAASAVLEVESYRFSEVKFAAWPFEGRTMTTFKTMPVRESRTFPAGSVVVPVSQTGARVAIHLLEPEGPDSFVAWGFFNAIFEHKEYAEDYVLEKLAREMLAKDEKLKREFEERVANDAKFAASPEARLRFFYERSPYWDSQLNLYPVGRVTQQLSVRLVEY
jgi:hypothetical protein